jgi:hypothetical protein
MPSAEWVIRELTILFLSLADESSLKDQFEYDDLLDSESMKRQ